MGQTITVVEKPTARSDVMRFELNRSLTGMGHEHYVDLKSTEGDRPPDLLARRLFESGEVDGVHIFSNIVTVDLKKGRDGHSLLEIMEDLFVHYLPGVVPTAV